MFFQVELNCSDSPLGWQWESVSTINVWIERDSRVTDTEDQSFLMLGGYRKHKRSRLSFIFT